MDTLIVVTSSVDGSLSKPIKLQTNFWGFFVFMFQLEGDESSGTLPETLDIGDVSESGLPADSTSLKQKNVAEETSTSSSHMATGDVLWIGLSFIIGFVGYKISVKIKIFYFRWRSFDHRFNGSV